MTSQHRRPPSPTPPPGPGATVYVAALPANTARITSLFAGGTMQWRARWPNGDPNLPQDGYTTAGTSTPATGAPPTPLPTNAKVYCSPQDGEGATPTLLTEIVLEPFDQHFNFTVPCPNVPAGQGPDKSAKHGRATYTYGPDVASPLFAGGACSGVGGRTKHFYLEV